MTSTRLWRRAALTIVVLLFMPAAGVTPAAARAALLPVAPAASAAPAPATSSAPAADLSTVGAIDASAAVALPAQPLVRASRAGGLAPLAGSQPAQASAETAPAKQPAPPVRTLSGVVVDRAGSPVTGASVSCDGVADARTAPSARPGATTRPGASPHAIAGTPIDTGAPTAPDTRTHARSREDVTADTATGAPTATERTGTSPRADTHTDARGHYALAVPPGPCRLVVRHPDYDETARVVTVGAGPLTVDLTLGPLAYRYQENVVVRAVRAEPTAPITMTDLPQRVIAARHLGQEMPFLLKDTPSMTVYADAGSTSGYSYLSLRGIQQTRLNMTLDGVPLNEPEDSAVYFSNYGDLAGSVDSIQVQRGVGTSSLGAASYGGSINFASLDPTDAPSLAAELGTGSFATTRATVTLNSGRLSQGLALYARAAVKQTDGYRDNAGAKQEGIVWGATRRGDRSSIKAFGFFGRARNQLAYLAVEPAVLALNPRTNPMAPDERDDFSQMLSHIQFTWFAGPRTSVSAQLYYQRADGWYRIFADSNRTALYQYGLNWQYGGAMVNAQHVAGGFTLTAGGHGYTYASKHSRDIVDGGHDYLNRGFKIELDAFAKAAWQRGRVSLWSDVQIRHAQFRYEGDVRLGDVSWTFVNPKAGARLALSGGISAYASIGQIRREPTRSDLFSGEDNPSVVYDLHAVKPERATDIEVGVNWRTAVASVSANVYAMEFRNEIALTGELSDIGLPLRRNVPRSHRRGVELEVDWRPARSVRLLTTANVSHDRIDTWTQYFDVYDAAGSWTGNEARSFRNVRPLLTPAVTINQRVEITPRPWLTASAASRYVASAWLDNTDTGALKTPDHVVLDFAAAVSLARWIHRGEPRVRLQVDNALNNRRIYASGYSYQYLDAPGSSSSAITTPYFYPQATRSLFVGFDVKM